MKTNNGTRRFRVNFINFEARRTNNGHPSPQRTGIAEDNYIERDPFLGGAVDDALGLIHSDSSCRVLNEIVV